MGMSLKVIKRDGTIVDFDNDKIVRAIRLSAKRTHKILSEVEEEIIVRGTINDLITRGFTNTVKVDDIHLSVENVLWTINRDLYSEYRSYNNYKKRFNHSFNNILKNAKNIVYEGDKENANKDSCLNSTKMTLTSELAGKEMYLEYELPKYLSDAHKNMDFYIHDTGHRFYNMINCIDENGWIYFKNDKGIKHIQLKDLNKMFNMDDGVYKVEDKCYVLGRNGWTRLKAIHKRETNHEDDIYTFRTRSGMKLKTTDKHRIPVIRDGKEITLEARNINKKDILLTSNGMSINPYEFDSKNYINLLDLEDSELNLLIVNLRPLQNYLIYKYQTTLYDLLDIPKTGVKRLTIQQFKEVLNKVEIPYEVFFKLRLKAKNSKNPQPLIIPINESLAKLYGYVYADGGVYVNEKQSTYHLTFTNTNLELIKDCQKCFEDCFDIKPNIIKPSGTSPCYRLCIGSKLIVKLFKEFCDGKFNGSSDISIPNFIINGSRTVKLAFLSSIIDCDGSFTKEQITYVSCSLKYTEQIIQIIQSLGYHAGFSKKDDAGSKYYFKHYNGTRNYDSYKITISRKEEIYKLYNELNTFKKNQTYDEYESEKSQKFIESKILDISITKENMIVYDLQTESGWFIVNDYVVHNCCLLDVANIYKDGYLLNGEFIKEPKTIETALDQLIDIILIASSQQYGGLTIPEVDSLLEPYAKKSFDMLMNKYNGNKDRSMSKLYEIMFRCFKRIQFKIKCVINAGGQTSFVTWTFGTSTSELGNLIVKAILDVRKQYMAVFPKLIYLYHSDISGEGKPNHDIYLQSIKCSMTQLYPDYCSAETGYLKEVYDRCGTIISAMGCVDGQEIITYKIKNDLYVESFERMWERLKCIFTEYEQPAKGNYYMDLSDVKIYDSSINGFTDIARVIKNKDKGDWVEVKFSNGRSILATSDHPLPIINKGRVFIKDIEVGDRININNEQYSEDIIECSNDEAWLTGFILCDGCYDNQFSVSIAQNGENDIEDRYKKSMKDVFGLETETIVWSRGKRGNYKEIRTRGKYKYIVDELHKKYGGLQKIYRHIPNEVFSWNRDAKLSFLAGMLDADGYINNTRKTRSVVQLGSTNKELALQTLALAQSLGYPARIYLNHYTSKDASKIRYRIEFIAAKDLVDKLACEKKKEKYAPGTDYKYTNVSEVKSVRQIGNMNKFSYDVTTNSDKFDVSAISSHNCRAYLSPWWDENNKERYIGRANLGAISLALPRYAIMSEGNKGKFFEILDKYFDYAMEVHELTYEKMRKVKAKTNPLMFCEGGGIYKLNPEDTIEKALQYMTYSIGYIGLTEVCYIMTGKHLHEDNSFAIEVLQHLNKRIEEAKSKHNKLIALYATPSEGYCDKLLRADKDKFGIIPNVTDKKWYHNSFHVGSNFEINAIEKQLKETPLFHLSNGGHIVYNEYPMSNNFQAFKEIIDFAMKHGLYYGVNVENNTCNDCGYVGDFKDTCPQCNSSNTTTITRCCGYLGYKKKNGDTRYNEGKDAEVDNRVKHFNCFSSEVR